jgi:LPXTG-motif cell wall-anchored protein
MMPATGLDAGELAALAAGLVAVGGALTVGLRRRAGAAA